MKKIKEKLKDRKNLVAILGIFGLLFITAGVSYAFFSYSRNGTTENTISSGAIKFIYTEENPGITLEDAMPMTDAQGMAQTNYFDFEVTSRVGSGMDIPYVVTARKTSDSTLPGEYVKLYLTNQNNIEIEPAKKYDTLTGYTNATLNIDANKNEKVLYEGIVPRNSNNYNKQFRLRMWISDDIDMNSNNDGVSIYNNTTFTIRVNVYADGEAISDEEATNRSNANIQSITVDGNNVTKVDNTHYTTELLIPDNIDSVTVPIVVNAQNSNAQVTIEKVNSIGQVIKEDGIKMLSTTKNVTVNRGTNYFKITVRPEDKSEPTIYYITIMGTDRVAGVFDENDQLLLNWGDLGNCDVENNYTSSNTFDSCLKNSDGINTKYKIVLPSSVTKIGTYAFYNSQTLISITIPSSVQTISNYAFLGAKYLNEINMEDGLLTIGAAAFQQVGRSADNPIIVHIPSTVTSINIDSASYHCDAFSDSKISSFVVDENNQKYASVDGVLYSKDLKQLLLYPSSSLQTSYSIPSSVNLIASEAFKYATNLRSITFSDTNNWHYQYASGSVIDVSDPQTNATNLKGNKSAQPWRKSN